ncbi:inositol monophosphatase/fructose-1,6-bisphosphatase family protein [Corynebacterium mustelae]|uniref:inositol-phosphate phosphatase n=1 Tax=Corynebacterium mustelae TaxID=571915 RepID=A0A0G3GZ01_9CORY|nr:inositol monophosphatase family protein [Corynebacterium mustelae]AKK06386.1 inositol monophosphatase/fructose-1,6-bisphosphatase family protein [Corynebacterium mustelae]
MSELRELYHIAEAVVDEAERMFRQGIGAHPSHIKDAGQFATEMDLAIEQVLREQLTALTGLPVFGEEYGGQQGTFTWVVDPIDGTANYAAGNPMSAILLSLMSDNQPVLAITSVPLVAQRFGAFDSSPLFINGQPQRPLTERPRVAAHVGFSSVSSTTGSKKAQFPSLMRHGLLAELTKTYLRPRITGSVGIDLAYTAAGIFGGAVSFSPHVWDNAAGVLLCRAAGAKVTDLDGNEWTSKSLGAIVGTDNAHETILSTMNTVRDSY